MENPGALMVAWSNKGERHEPEFKVTFVPYDPDGKETEPLTFLGEESLWAFLALSLALGGDRVEPALSELHESGSAVVEYVTLSDEEMGRFKQVV
jgi:hypothetical protein